MLGRRVAVTHGSVRGVAPALLAGTMLFSMLTIGGCSNRHETDFGPAGNDPDVSGIEAPRVRGLRAQVGSRAATLMWDDADVESYRIFRKQGEDLEIEIEDAVTDTTYFDGGLTNGLVYRYRVAGQLANGLQGDPSDPVFVVPSAYSMLIEDGAEFANDIDLDLTLNAAGGTTSMRFGETAAAAQAAGWRSFSTFATFRISAGDGVRTVFAQFLDQGGNESQVVFDDVTLDTRAEVLSVAHDAGSAPVAPGSTIRFTVMTGEVDGKATIDIEGGEQNIELFDDGAHGDGGANDGTYAVDWVVPAEAEVSDAIVEGVFEDAAGNVARGTATQTLTLNGPPSAVVLHPASNVMAGSVELSWSQNQNGDFSSYRVLRALTADVLNDPGRVIVTTIDVRSTTTYVDDEVNENSQVFYLVEVVDDFGASTPSNTITVTTPNAAPPAVVLSEDANTPVSVSMSWTESAAQDFALYRILRAMQSQPGSFAEVAQFDQQTRTNYTDFFAASADTTYYFYKVIVEDLSGDSSESNVISVAVGP